MVKVSIQSGYAILLAIMNGAVLAITYLATQNTANGLTITVGVQAVLVGVEGALHYETSQPTTTSDQASTLTQVQSLVETIRDMINGSNTASTTTSAPAVLPDQDVGTFQGWLIKVVGGELNIYPPAAMAKVLGPVMNLGTVAGWPANTDWISVASPAILAAIQTYQNAVSGQKPSVTPPVPAV